MNELKPCPWCGGKPREYDGYVECCLTINIDPEDWNSRPIEDELRKRIVELEEELAGDDIWKDIYGGEH